MVFAESKVVVLGALVAVLLEVELSVVLVIVIVRLVLGCSGSLIE